MAFAEKQGKNKNFIFKYSLQFRFHLPFLCFRWPLFALTGAAPTTTTIVTEQRNQEKDIPVSSWLNTFLSFHWPSPGPDYY